jgi:hypothetical protein
VARLEAALPALRTGSDVWPLSQGQRHLPILRARTGRPCADDAPPYFTILIVAHIIVPLMLMFEQRLQPPEWQHMALWPPLTVLLCLWLLPRIKGVLIGLQWARRMHGFGSEPH